MKHIRHRNNERGATLILALVILAAMTVFGMSSMRNTATQQNILKNSQLYRNAQIIASNESNAQLDFINTNTDDEIVQQALDTDEDVDIDVTEIADEYGGLKSPKTGYEQKLYIRRKDEPRVGSAAGGSSLGAGKASIRTMVIEIDSTAALASSSGDDNSNSTSNQIQGVEITLPPLGI